METRPHPAEQIPSGFKVGCGSSEWFSQMLILRYHGYVLTFELSSVVQYIPGGHD